jgi:predicted nucleic-acid-binding protein
VIGLDTNVVVRFLAQDDPVQSPIATRVIGRLSREQPGFISGIVLAEVTWVLSRAYKASRADIAAAVEGLLRAAELKVENADAAYRALGRYLTSTSVEYADALIAETAALAGAAEVVTFDQNAARELGLRLLK